MKKKKGFTLVELLVVIAIIGILFVVLISKVDFATDKAKETGVKTDFRSFQMAAETVLREEGEAKLSLANLNKNIDQRLQVAIDTGLSNNATADPWGKAYKVAIVKGDDTGAVAAATAVSAGTFKTTANLVKVTSGGPNGTIGTGDDDRVLYVGIDTNGSIQSVTSGFSNNLK